MQKMTKYKKVMAGVALLLPEKVRPIFLHPAGPTTIFFWAPTFKWGLVFANIGDVNRPAEKISINQTAVLATTAAIWCRYSLVIIPKNWNLFLVNFFIVLTSAYQVGRAIHYNHNIQK